MYLVDIETERGIGRSQNPTPPPRPSLPRRVSGWLLAAALLPLVLVGIILSIPPEPPMKPDDPIPDFRD